MKRFLTYIFALILPFASMAQTEYGQNQNSGVGGNVQPSRPQYVVFQIYPADASLIVEGKSYPLDNEGIAMLLLNNGTYNYTISAKDHRDETGNFVVSGAKIEKVVKLRSACGFLSVSGNGTLSGARVYVDDVFLGTAPIKSGKLASGIHKVRIEQPLYKTYNGAVIIKEEETLDFAPSLVADYATVSITVNSDCDIYVDNRRVGKRTWRGNLATGNYIFEARKAGHRSTSIFRTIAAIPSQQSYTIPAPIAIKGTLNVVSTHAMADVCVDGKVVGRTPLITDLIIGTHEIILRKGELATKRQSVTIAEGKTTELNLTLTQTLTEQEPPKPKHQTYIETESGLNMKMVYVEGGTFQMGATSEQGSDAYSDETPVHTVTLDSYYIAECEVTQEQWQKIMGGHFTGDYYHPVRGVSWEEAKLFCKELSRLTGKRYVLPTEAQWEYAARGGKYSKGYKYSGSNTIDNVAWYWDNSRKSPHAVKQKHPNELGLYDMSGNVYEWCSDWYRYGYPSNSQTNPTGPSSGNDRVLRGGGYGGDARDCRVSGRFYAIPSHGLLDYGFRVCALP